MQGVIVNDCYHVVIIFSHSCPSALQKLQRRLTVEKLVQSECGLVGSAKDREMDQRVERDNLFALLALLTVLVNGDNDSFFLRLLQNELDETLKKVPIDEANNNYVLAQPIVARINLTAIAFEQLLSQYKDKDPDMNDATVQAKYKKVQKDLDIQFQTLVQQYTGINITEIV